MCRQSGAMIGAGETQCAVCGASTAPQQRPAHAQVDHETMRFARAVLDRPYKFTIIILIANLFVFLLMSQSSGLTSQVLWNAFPEPVLEAYGAKLNVLIQAGQWWRFVTPMFIHVNLPHLLVNMYSLWVVGPYVERLYGSARFVVFWVLTGIAGVVASYLTVRPNMPGSFLGRFFFKPLDVPSAGASGALFGLVGVLFVFGIKFRHRGRCSVSTTRRAQRRCRNLARLTSGCVRTRRGLFFPGCSTFELTPSRADTASGQT